VVETKDREAEVVDTPEEHEWRVKLREWLANNAPRRRVRSEDDDDLQLTIPEGNQTNAVESAKAWQAKLCDAGYGALTWPKEYGGQGLSRRYQQIFGEESAGYDMPLGFFGIGMGMCAPTILTHGTEELKRRYLPKLLRGEEIWSQLFSEPGAGSDVASLQTRAVRSGDEWILNGQKVWTSGAQYSDYGCIIARTDVDVPKHQGITMFVVNLKAPGVTVKPLRQITGGASFNEVFFDDVRVPNDHVLGDVNGGWKMAITMLMNERVSIGAGGLGGGGGGGRRRGGAASNLIKEATKRGLNTDPVIRQKLMDVFIHGQVLSYVGQRISAAVKMGVTPSADGSLAKLSGALLGRKSAVLGAEIAGANAAAWEEPRDARFANSVLGFSSGTIAGGTNEIMRNIIGERILGLPKEPQVDRDVPFRELKVGTQRPGA
jgi:alkylation response protein AidB-like acyl-CoA dehydrogenase